MNTSRQFRMLLCWVMMAMAPALAGETPGMRTWTSRSGAVIEAEFAGEQGGQVTLKKADGTLVRAALHQLSDDDQAFIRTQTTRPPNTGVASSALKTRKMTDLPTAGRNDAYVYYEATKFDAVMDAKGYLRVYPKSNGQRVGQPITFRLVTAYNDPDMKGRPIKSWEGPARPQVQPSSLVLRGHMDTDSVATYSIAFSPDDIQFRIQVEDPKEISYPTDIRLYAYFTRPSSVKEGMKYEEIISAVAKHRLALFPVKGNRMEIPFDQDVSAGISRSVERADVISPEWEGLKPVFTINDAKKTFLRAGFDYGAVALYEGFHLMFNREQQNADNPKEYLRFTLE
jgi:hypothetical protein